MSITTTSDLSSSLSYTSFMNKHIREALAGKKPGDVVEIHLHIDRRSEGFWEDIDILEHRKVISDVTSSDLSVRFTVVK